MLARKTAVRVLGRWLGMAPRARGDGWDSLGGPVCQRLGGGYGRFVENRGKCWVGENGNGLGHSQSAVPAS